MQLDERELGAVLAGLRLLDLYLADPHLDSLDVHGAIPDIATDGGTHEPLGPTEIDMLCERLNTAPDVPEWAFDIVMQLAHENILTDEYVGEDFYLEQQQRLQEEAIGTVQAYLHMNKIWR